jgi:hypothetical protein
MALGTGRIQTYATPGRAFSNGEGASAFRIRNERAEVIGVVPTIARRARQTVPTIPVKSRAVRPGASRLDRLSRGERGALRSFTARSRADKAGGHRRPNHHFATDPMRRPDSRLFSHERQAAIRVVLRSLARYHDIHFTDRWMIESRWRTPAESVERGFRLARGSRRPPCRTSA